MIGPRFFLFYLALLAFIAVATASKVFPEDRSTVHDVNWSGAIPDKLTAYATVFHDDENTKSDARLLATKILIKTLRQTGTTRDIIVLCSRNTRALALQQLRAAGAIVQLVPDAGSIVDPMGLQTWYPCEQRFKKIFLWGLTDYQRVIYLDPDVVVNLNLDELFLCGDFCMVYANQFVFTTGVFVIKPDQNKLQELKAAFKNFHLKKPGFGQWFYCNTQSDIFFLEVFNSIEAAPLFSYSQGQRREPVMRLPINYQVNAMLYNEHFAWHLIGAPECKNFTIASYSLGFPTFKPWKWMVGAFFPLYWVWNDIRQELFPESYNMFYFASALLILSYPLILQFLSVSIIRLCNAFPKVRMSTRVLHIWGIKIFGLFTWSSLVGAAVSLFSGLLLAKNAIPPLTPTWHAWPVFIVHHCFCLFICCKVMVFILYPDANRDLIMRSDAIPPTPMSPSTPSNRRARMAPYLPYSLLILPFVLECTFYYLTITLPFPDFPTKMVVFFIFVLVCMMSHVRMVQTVLKPLSKPSLFELD